MRAPTPTHLNTFVRDSLTWPAHKRKKIARNRERKAIARKGQQERDQKTGQPNR